MAKICLCLTGKTLEQNLEILEEYRGYIDMAELRVDCLDPDERFLIRSFPEKAGLPVILTIRRKADGGFFEDGEGSRVALLSKGIAFAEVDRRRNFAYIDIEEDLEVPGLEEVVRTFGTRIIRSYHNIEGTNDDIPGKLKKLLRVGDEIAKIAVTPHTMEDVVKVYRAARETRHTEKILLCMGHLGVNTRILAAKIGSYLCYCSASERTGLHAAAPGQLDPKELVNLYRFRGIGKTTRVFGLAGFPLKVTNSPHIFNTAFNHEKINAVYLPFPSDSLKSFFDLAEEIGLAGAAITIPYKEEVISLLKDSSAGVKAAGACNTIVPVKAEPAPERGTRDSRPGGWTGYNTDSAGFSGSLLSFIGKKHFHGLGITVLGAGGAAGAVVSEISRLRGKCLILNRNQARAKELAAPYKYKWGGLDGRGLDMMDRYSDIIVQTTPVGTVPDIEADPFDLYRFTGRETVMDLIYRPERTAFLKRAEKAGCKVLNGFDMLVRQATLQYQLFLSRDFPMELIPRLEKIVNQ
ncbi:MAG: type I 3-dehydroquinate dehydratase [Treponema sp.]|jgi:3-dehydroquinate dehydratase/shikimate dehydrogenase|nr:type I 3-dehydroquinate dehydratase [Treponema sp.]